MAAARRIASHRIASHRVALHRIKATAVHIGWKAQTEAARCVTSCKE